MLRVEISQHHAWHLAMRGIAMLSVDKLPCLRQQTGATYNIQSKQLSMEHFLKVANMIVELGPKEHRVAKTCLIKFEVKFLLHLE